MKGEVMKRMFVLSLVLAVALIGIAPPVSRAEDPADYVVLKGGIYSPSSSYNLNNFNGGSTTRLDSKTGFTGEIAVGHYFLPILAAELGVGYFESKGSPATPPGESRLRVVPVIATGKLFLPIGPIQPYGEFGIGAYITALDLNGNSGSLTGSTKVTYGLHAGGGVNVDITPVVFVGVEGRYLWARPSFGGQDIKLDGFTATADLGFRF